MYSQMRFYNCSGTEPKLVPYTYQLRNHWEYYSSSFPYVTVIIDKNDPLIWTIHVAGNFNRYAIERLQEDLNSEFEDRLIASDKRP